jgi:small subunit ribosomal protein S9
MAKKEKNLKYYEAIGRRKESVAQVRLYIADKNGVTIAGKKILAGEMLVNTLPFEKSFAREVDKQRLFHPLQVTETMDRFAISIVVRGGGKNGQIEAISHGISRALTLVDETTYKTLLKKHDLTTRDPRAKERRKVGTGGKARRQKQSPKR